MADESPVYNQAARCLVMTMGYRLGTLSKSFGSLEVSACRAASRKRAYCASRSRSPGFRGALDFALRDGGLRWRADLRGMKSGYPPLERRATRWPPIHRPA